MNYRIALLLLIVVSGLTHESAAQYPNWFPVEGRLMTQWSGVIDPNTVLPDYPRPGMVRSRWMNLNGLWEFSLTGREEGATPAYRRQILVPFSVESAMSGVGIRVDSSNLIWYRKTFILPDDWSNHLVYLHFGASDWETTVYVNGQMVGIHRGGYDPFSFDISYYLRESGSQQVEISVWDPTDQYYQPRGKQSSDPKGIWYTPVSGIWQTVWLEPVPLSHIGALRIRPDFDAQEIQLRMKLSGTLAGDSLYYRIGEDNMIFFEGILPADSVFSIPVPNAISWSPENPYLYDFQLELRRSGQVVDEISSYFGMRKIEVAPDARGVPRIFLNNRPVFMLGVLDQGWWPDGLYTAPSGNALVYDLDQIKQMGYNTVRKHVKVEPALWYYHCDRLGLLVWQDMPNGDRHARWEPPSGLAGEEIEREFASEMQYRFEFESIVGSLYNHPSIVCWVPFNEGWGQFKTEEITKWVKQLDPDRLVGGPSGGNDFPAGDTRDHHQYPGPGIPEADGQRALVLGEFGGLGLAVKGNMWAPGTEWSYQQQTDRKTLLANYTSLIGNLRPLMEQGLCAAIYTQLSDVESEINGLLTYNRKVIKLSPGNLRKLHQPLYPYYMSIVPLEP